MFKVPRCHAPFKEVIMGIVINYKDVGVGRDKIQNLDLFSK